MTAPRGWHARVVFGGGAGGSGWGGFGGVITFMSTSTPTQCYAMLALAHSLHATLQMLTLGLAHALHATLQMLLLALAHVLHATLQMLMLALAHVLHATLQMLLLALAAAKEEQTNSSFGLVKIVLWPQSEATSGKHAGQAVEKKTNEPG